MKHYTEIGNCSHIIDWNSVIDEIKDVTPGTIGPRQNWDDPSIKHIADIWKSAGYKPVSEGGSAEWAMYYPGQQFSKEVLTKFLDYLHIEKYNSCWISRIMPGQCAPLHVDLRIRNIVEPNRIHVHIGDMDPGHVTIIEDEHLFNKENGSMIQWRNPDSWHCSFNIGKTPSYLFHIY